MQVEIKTYFSIHTQIDNRKKSDRTLLGSIKTDRTEDLNQAATGAIEQNNREYAPAKPNLKRKTIQRKHDDLPEITPLASKKRKHDRAGSGGAVRPPDASPCVEKALSIRSYSGGLHMGLPHGKGEALFEGGDRYAGEWANGSMTGQGTYSYADGNHIFTGLFNHNMFRYGKMVYGNGDIYEGEWKGEKMHGYGKYTHAAVGDAYEGQWAEDNRHGTGTLTYHEDPFYKEYAGEWRNDAMTLGTMKFKNGNVYTGQWKNNIMHGQGTMTYANEGKSDPNPDQYTGAWKKGLPDGCGIFKTKHGTVCEGMWKSFKMNGKCEVKFKNGNCFEGEWQNGLRHGKGKMKHENTIVFEAEWANGKRKS